MVAHFYDSRGNNVEGLQQVELTPGTLKMLQSGVFNIKDDWNSCICPAGVPIMSLADIKSKTYKDSLEFISKSDISIGAPGFHFLHLVSEVLLLWHKMFYDARVCQ